MEYKVQITDEAGNVQQLTTNFIPCYKPFI